MLPSTGPTLSSTVQSKLNRVRSISSAGPVAGTIASRCSPSTSGTPAAAAAAIADETPGTVSMATSGRRSRTAFASFGNLAKAGRERRPDVAIETVPGVSSAMAAAAAAGVPLVDGEQRLAIVPATGPADEIERTLLSFDCTVLLKVGPVLGSMLALLERLGLFATSVYVRRCGQPEQQIVTELRGLAADPPSDY